MPQIFNSQRIALSLAALFVMAATSSTVWADPIAVSTGNIAPTAEMASLLILAGGLVGTAGIARRRLNKQRQK